MRAASERARDASAHLRWHQALRRRIPECAAESRVRGAWASAELDGARGNIDIVRDLMRGARPRSAEPDPAERVLHGAMAATAATEELATTARGAPRRTLARLHLAAAAELVDEAHLGRPRTEAGPPITNAPGRGAGDAAVVDEFAALGPAPPASDLLPRLAALDQILAADDLPALLVVAITHGELATMRPFDRGNGLVARAMDRALLRATGLDPTGVVVIEAGHGSGGIAGYHGALAAYAQASLVGLLVWLDHCADAVVAGAADGTAIADAVLAGRLRPG